MSNELRQLDILIGATQYQIRKAQEVFDSLALSSLQEQYRLLIFQRSKLLSVDVIVKEAQNV